MATYTEDHVHPKSEEFSDPSRAIDIYLAEYNTLRTEQLARVQTQNQAFNFLLVVAAAAITAVITSANGEKNGYLPIIFLAVTVMLPLATCPLAFIFFDNEIMIHAIGSYLYYNRRPQILRRVGDDNILGSHLAFERLPVSTHRIFPVVSRGRWLLFCIPTLLPALVLPFYVFQQWDTLSLYLSATDFYSTITTYAVFIVYIIDLVSCAYLLKAISWTFQNARHQEGLHKNEMDARRQPEQAS